jgi:WD40 repeat protein
MSLLRYSWLLFVLLPAGPLAGQGPAPKADRLEALWADLASPDAARAYQAILALTAAPARSVPLLKARLRPVPTPDPKRLARLLKDLQSPRFAVREKAMTELARLGELAEPALRKAAGEGAPLEFRRRVDQLLDKLQGVVTQPKQLRTLRAVEVLEHVGTPEAREVLRKLATGAPGSRITQEAQSSLERLRRRPPAAPVEEGKRGTADGDGLPLPPGAVARLGTTRLREPYGPAGVAFTPDGKAVLAAGEGGKSLVFWDTTTGKCLRRLRRDDALFQHFALSPDGKLLACAGTVSDAPRQGALTVWDTGTWKLRRIIPYPDGVSPSALAWAPDSKAVWTGNSDGSLRLWDVRAGKELLRPQLTPFPLTHLAVSPDGRRVAAGSQRLSDAIFLWDGNASASPRRVKIATNGILSLAFSPDGRTLAVGTAGGLGVRLWDVASGRVRRSLSQDQGHDYPNGLAFSRHGKTLAAVGGHSQFTALVFWDPATGKQVRRFVTGMDGPHGLAFSADGRLLAASTVSGVRLWRLDTGREVAADVPGHRGLVNCVVFSPAGDFVATACDDHTVRVWEAATGRQRLLLRHDFWVRAVAVSPDGKLLASSSLDDTVRVWDARTGREIYRLPGHGRLGGLRELRFSPDGRTLASWGDDLYVRVWSVANGKALAEHRLVPPDVKLPDEDEPDAVTQRLFLERLYFLRGAFAPDGRTFYLADRSQVYRFDIWTGKARAPAVPLRAPGLASPVLPADGRLLLVHEAGVLPSVSLWHLPGLKLFRRIPVPEQVIGEAAFAPDGRMVAVLPGYAGGKVHLFELATARRRLSIAGVRFGHCLAFSPDGRLLATGMADGTMLVWELARFRK